MLVERDKVTNRRSQRPYHEAYDVLVLDARLRQSLVTVRSIGSRELRIAALETIEGLPVPAFSSRWCHQKSICPAREGTKEFLTYLEKILDCTQARVLRCGGGLARW